MKTIIMAATAFAAISTFAGLADFDSLTTGPNGYYKPDVGGVYNWQDDGASFGLNVDPTYFSWDGWTYSDVNDTNTAGFGNQYAVFGDGQDRSGTGNYAVGYYSSWGGSNPTVTFSGATQVNGFYAMNTTYAALDMMSGSGYSDAFSTNDWLKLSVEGFNNSAESQGVSDMLLADFTGYTAGDNKNNYMLTDWDFMDLTGLGNDVYSLKFSVTSSANGTPTYLAMDELSFVAVPEPSSVLLMLGGFAGMVWFRRRRKYMFRG